MLKDIKLGLVVATKREFETVFIGFNENEYQIVESKPFTVIKLTIKNKDLYVIEAGCGEILAGAATQHLIDKYDINCVLNYGVVGSLVDNIGLQSTCVISSIIDYEFDTTLIDKMPIGYHEGLTDNKGLLYPTRELIDFAKSINETLIEVRCASGNKFVGIESKKNKLHEEFDASICEMEASAIQLVATKNNVKTLFIKGISDSKAGGAEEFDRMIIESSKTAFEVIKSIVEHYN